MERNISTEICFVLGTKIIILKNSKGINNFVICFLNAGMKFVADFAFKNCLY